MIKYMKKIILTLVIVLVMPQLVMAAGLSCDNSTYRVSRSGTNTITFGDGSTYNLNFYNVSGATKTYCLDPGKTGPNGTSYNCGRMIDPTGENSGVGSKLHALDVAISRAYYRLYQEHNSNSNTDRSIGELVFRWLFFNYNMGDMGSSMGATGTRYISYFQLQKDGTPLPIWNSVGGNQSIVNTAREIYLDAKRVGDSVYTQVCKSRCLTYKQLVSQGELPNEEFQYTVETETDASMGGRKTYIVTFTGTPSANVWWGDFQVGVTNSSVKIERVLRNDSGSTIVIYVNEGNYTGSYDLYIDTAYYLESSALTSMKVLSPNSAGVQKMLIAVDSGDAGKAHELIKGGKRIHINKERCTPDGTQVCEYDENDVPQSCRPSNPGECGEPTRGTCRVENGMYYGVAGNLVTPTVFFDECCESGILTDEQYDKYCPCGYPDVDNYKSTCTEFNSDDEEVKSTVKDTKDNAHLKTCLFNNASTDAAGNTVRMSDQETVVNNPYCKVGCVEEYEFTLPNAQYTTSGSYFRLSSSVFGKRTCYANASDSGNFNGIDHTKFINDLYEASKKLASAQSTYNQLKGALENIKMDTKNGCAKVDMYWNDEYKYKSYSVSISGNNISLSEEEITMERNHWLDGSGGKEDSSGKCHGGDKGTEDGLKEKILGTTGSGDNKKTKSLSDYAEAITRAQAKIQSILKQYDNCFSWNNNFKFDPKIHFDYDEPYNGMKDFEHLFSEVHRDATTSDGYCNNTDSSYNCNGSSSTYAQSYITCSDGKCSTATQDVISQVYLKKESSVSADYQPKNEFSVYTPLGTITFNRDKGLYTILCNENDCLPVSLNAKTGVFNFEFKFSDIGQYNDSNALGRLMGGSLSVLETKKLKAGYVCQYVNNCPECGYTCVGDKCDIVPDPECPDCPYVCQNCVFDGSENTYFYRTVSVNNLFPNTKTRDVGPNWNTSKGIKTKKAIQDSGESVYSTPEYSYTITPNQMKRIREYNNSVGGYLNATTPNGDDALTCYDKNGYENVYCTSAFLDTTGNTYFTQNVRNDEWTLMDGSITDGVGPAWR